MTVTETNAPRSTSAPATNLNDLADRIDATVTEALGASVVAFRALANESQITGARRALSDQTDALKASMDTKRERDAALAKAREEHTDALAEIEWKLADSFRFAGNKTYLAKDEKGVAIAEEDQRTMTADERREWIARTAEKQSSVTGAAVRKAELASQQAADEVRITEKRWSAANAQLNAAAAWLTAMSNAISTRGNGA